MISFSDFFIKAPMGMLMVQGGVVTKCNPAFIKIFKDIPVSEIVNIPVQELFTLPEFDFHSSSQLYPHQSGWLDNPDENANFHATLGRSPTQYYVEVVRISVNDDARLSEEECYIVTPSKATEDLTKQHRYEEWFPAKSKADKRLSKEQKRYMEAMRMAKLAYWKIHIQEKIMELSKEFGFLIGEQWEEPKSMALEHYINTYIHPSDRGRLMGLLEAQEGPRYSDNSNVIEFKISRKNGGVLNVLNTFRVGYNDNGEVIDCEGVLQDITLLRKAEDEVRQYQKNLESLVARRTEQLAKSEEKLQDALKLGNLTTWEFSFETKKYYGGGEISQIVGPLPIAGENGEIEVEEFEKMIHPEDLPVYYNSFQRALKACDENYIDYISYRIVRSDGEIRHLYLSIKIEMEDDQRYSKLYGTIQDITSMKIIEEEKERLKALVEVTPDIVVVIDPQGELIYLNQSGRYFYGLLEKNQIKGLNFFDLQKTDAKKVLKNTALPIAASEGIWKGETELASENNQIVPVSMVMVAHFGRDEAINSFSLIIRDISTQKRTEQDLLFKNAELDTFVYRASHDLRGPISSLLGLYQIVQYEIKDEKSLAFFEMFNKQILRLNGIILALINLTKIKENKAGLVQINFMDIINDAIDSFRHLNEFSNIKFQIKVNVKENFMSDKGMITTILQNLVENAIKYSKRNIPAIVDIRVESHHGKFLTVRVEDNGIGIADDIQVKVFDMFFRGNEISRGSGLGLYILKNAVEKLKGKIILKSKENVGTTFIIELPYIG